METKSVSEYQFKIIFEFLDAVQAKNSVINLEETPPIVKELEFNPTLGEPNITFTDYSERDFSVWYRPVIYHPKHDAAKEMIIDFVIVEGNHNSLYRMDYEIQKLLKTHEFFTGSLTKDISIRLLAKKNPVHMLLFVRKNFNANDMMEIKNAMFFLRPKRTLIVSEEYLETAVKMNLPLGMDFVENVDMNTDKLKQVVKRII